MNRQNRLASTLLASALSVGAVSCSKNVKPYRPSLSADSEKMAKKAEKYGLDVCESAHTHCAVVKYACDDTATSITKCLNRYKRCSDKYSACLSEVTRRADRPARLIGE